MSVDLKCNDTRRCFARNGQTGRCRVLIQGEGSKPYANGACPFCKPKAEVTHGKVYPHRDYLASMK